METAEPRSPQEHLSVAPPVVGDPALQPVDLPRCAIGKVEALRGFHFHEAEFNALPHNQLVNVARRVERQSIPQAVFQRGLGGFAQGRLRLGTH